MAEGAAIAVRTVHRFLLRTLQDRSHKKVVQDLPRLEESFAILRRRNRLASAAIHADIADYQAEDAVLPSGRQKVGTRSAV
jgi:hypothetical protein